MADAVQLSTNKAGIPKRKTKEQCEVMVKLLDVAWQNFERRRAYEWKLSLGIWTAVAAFIAITLKARWPGVGEKQLVNIYRLMPDLIWYSLVGGAAGILVIQFWLLWRVKLGNACDQARAHCYEALINGEFLDVSFLPDESCQRWVAGWRAIIVLSLTIAAVILAFYIRAYGWAAACLVGGLWLLSEVKRQYHASSRPAASEQSERDVQISIAKTKGLTRLGGWWSVVFHLSITTVLLAIAAAVLLL